MFNLQIYQIATKTVRPIMTSSVHRGVYSLELSI